MSNDNINNIEVTRHSLSHILALAVLELWPDVKFAIGPAIESGFYYDFDFGEEKIGEEDLIKIEKKMNHLIKQNLKFEKSELSCEEAIKKEKKAGQDYKVELIKDLKKDPSSAKVSAGKGEKKVSYYKLGKFEDLCRGPHIESIGKIAKGSFKLTKIAGAYWRGDEKNKMLTRVYGVAFDSKKELDEYLKMITEAEKRDHRKLGKEL
ncbi:threonine--tRNA ligase, partial [Candidatus Parcubacteria bacterium]|nr:threonine--tRNA ligase [Candidatus Parcubacteria bacterium]